MYALVVNIKIIMNRYFAVIMVGFAIIVITEQVNFEYIVVMTATMTTTSQLSTASYCCPSQEYFQEKRQDFNLTAKGYSNKKTDLLNVRHPYFGTNHIEEINSKQLDFYFALKMYLVLALLNSNQFCQV